MRNSARYFAPIALAVLMAAGSAVNLTAQAADKVTVGVTGSFGPNYAPYFFGQDLGFWDEQEIEVDFVSLKGSAIMIPQLAGKQVDISSVTPELLIAAIAKGEPFPIRLVLNSLRRNLWRFGVLEDSSLQSLSDLDDKVLGVGALTWGNLPSMAVILGDAGVTWSDEVDIQPVGMGPAAWKQLETGSVNALNLQVWELEKARLAGVPIRFLPVPDKFANVIGNGFATHVDFIADNDRIVRFGKAYVQSLVACEANRRACLKSFVEANPEQGPSGDLDEWLDQQVVLTGSYFSIQDLEDGATQWGHYPAEAVDQLISLMKEGGRLEADAEIDTSLLYTNELVDAFNDVDLEAVRAKAQAR